MKPSNYYSRLILIGLIIFALSSLRSYAQDLNGNAYKESMEEKKLTAYISEHATDVIELDDEKIIGKLTGETPNVIFIKRIGGDIEEKIDRSTLKNMRKPTAEELRDLKILLKDYEIKNKTIPQKKESKKISNKKYQKEVRSAQRARRELDSQKTNKDKIEKAKKEGYVCNGMDIADVVEVLGRPNRREESYKGSGKRDIWYYNNRSVKFYDGKVRQ